MAPSEGYATTDDGVRLYFRTVGSGPEAVLPNGFPLFDDFQHLARWRTLIFSDVRNRGRSDATGGGSILQDADDLDAVRRYFGIPQLDLIAHSYMGVMAGVYAMKYAAHLRRVVQIGPMQPDAAKQYPADLTGADSVLGEVLTQIAQLLKDRDPMQDPQETCEQFWRVLRPIYVVNPADAGRISWGRCELPNERNVRRYMSDYILPSIQNLHFSTQDLVQMQAPVLIVHGKRDRSSPYGGGRDWARLFPNARLLTVENAGHAPWIEAPETVFGSLQSFLDGEWPEATERLSCVE